MRNIGIVVIALVAGFVGAEVRGVSADSGSIRTSEITLVDLEGKACARFALDEDGKPMLHLKWGDEQSFRVVCTDSGPGVLMTGKRAQAIFMSVGGDMPMLSLDNGKKARVLALSKDGVSKDGLVDSSSDAVGQ